MQVGNVKTAAGKQRRELVKERIFLHSYFAPLQRQVTTAVVTVVLAFFLTWVLPNQVIAVLMIMYPPSDNTGAALKLHATMSLGLP